MGALLTLESFTPIYRGRVELGEPNRQVQIGGAHIKAGDLIVADGRGAIVVPPSTSHALPTSQSANSRAREFARGWSFM